MNISGKQLSIVGLLCLMLALSLAERLYPVAAYNSSPEIFMAGGHPVLTNLDGYYYLSKARELDLKTSVPKIHRAVPDGVKESHIPLISICIYSLSRFTGLSINEAGLYLPVFLSLLAAIPIFIIGLLLENGTVALIATSITMLAPCYAGRSSYGFVDTDCLNSFFPLVTILLSLLFMRSNERRNCHVIYVISLVNFLFFLLWWDQSPVPPVILAALPLCTSILLKWRSGAIGVKTSVVYIFGICLPLLFTYGGLFVLQFYKSFVDLFSLVLAHQSPIFPNPGSIVSELRPLGIFQYGDYVFSFGWLILMSLAGGFFLITRHCKEATLIVPVFLVGIGTFFIGRRFQIFLAPITGLCFAIFCNELLKFMHRFLFKKRKNIPVVLLYGSIIVLCFCQFSRFPFSGPIFNASEVKGMQALRLKTPPDSLIWNFWDAGYPIMYWGERDTVNDGGVFSSPIRTWAHAVPFAASDDRFAANFINFYVHSGVEGIQQYFDRMRVDHLPRWELLKKALSTGPENISRIFSFLPEFEQKRLEKFIFPPQTRPVYLFIESRMARFSTNLCWLGQWNPDVAQSNRYLIRLNLTFPPVSVKREDDTIPHFDAFSINDDTGLLSAPILFKEPLYILEFYKTNDDETVAIKFAGNAKKMVSPQYTFKYSGRPEILKSNGQYTVDLIAKSNQVLIRDKQISDSLVHRFFWRKNAFDPRYFHLVDSKDGVYQIWKVTPDAARLPKKGGQ